MSADRSGTKLIASNRKARHDYAIEDTIECGMVLLGSEVKSLREGQVRIADAYARESARTWVDTYVLRVDGKPTSNFGTRSYYNGQRRSPHAGVDFVGKPGTPIRAANRSVTLS